MVDKYIITGKKDYYMIVEKEVPYPIKTWIPKGEYGDRIITFLLGGHNPPEPEQFFLINFNTEMFLLIIAMYGKV